MASLVALIAGLTGGCSHQAAPASLPPGFQSYRGTGVSFGYPSGWRIEKSTDASGLPLVKAVGPTGDGSLHLGIALGQSRGWDRSNWPDHVGAFRANQAVAQPLGKIVDDRSLAVPGALDAHLWEIDYPSGASPTPIKDIEIHALAPGKVVWQFLVHAPKSDFEKGGLDRVEGTLRVG